jgi:DNA adenine methylase
MNSTLAYIGGKSKLANTIIDMMPEHKAYCEAFAGAAWVFFKKPMSKYEVINDLDSDLVTFYRVLQNHLEEFLRQFKWLLSSREWFEDWKKQQDAGGLTDIQRAARYYYLQRLCFGGRVKSRVFGTAPMRSPRINLLRIEEELSEVHLRLARVSIEHLPWEDLISRYDKPETLFYCDPPYYKAPFYNHNRVSGSSPPRPAGCWISSMRFPISMPPTSSSLVSAWPAYLQLPAPWGSPWRKRPAS